MIKDELHRLILRKLGHSPTSEQDVIVEALTDFLLSGSADSLFLLRGYAGTGKTTLIGALVKVLDVLRQKVVLLAPTGRAAKVFSLYAGHPAFTIHKKVYRQRSFSDEVDNFTQNVNLYQHTLFIVDEASMIANEGLSGAVFGTGRLLDDLVQFVYSGQGCRLLLVGDSAQLPPVGEEESPALSADMLRGYNLEISEGTLTQVVRQIQDSGILWNATRIRQLIRDEDVFGLPRVRLAGFPDVRRVPGNELIECLEECYSKCGTDQTVVITRSNKRANLYNNGVRARILGYEEELTGGDQLIVVKNNYYWAGGKEEENGMEFIANGDVATVLRFRRERSLYGFRFADVLLRFTDYDDYEVEATVLLDTLQTDAPALTRDRSQALFQAVWNDYPEVTTKCERMKKVKQDIYYNALQIKYSYAITCHKAQGGQWQNVFIDQGYMTEDMLTPDYFRWLYTAFTRATDRLFLVNWPKEQLEDTEE